MKHPIPTLSKHYTLRVPSEIRQAQMIFSERSDKHLVDVINVAIGNVSLPLHPKMFKKLKSIGINTFKDGVVKYTPSNGIKNARMALLKIISADIGFKLDNIYSQITDGGSQAMELMLLGVCGPNSSKPLMIFEPTYTNYIDFCNRLSIPLISYERSINSNGNFKDLDISILENIIQTKQPSAILIIPYDNPTGLLLKKKDLISIAKLCVKYNIWLVSDEAYRGLSYKNHHDSVSIWSLSNKIVPDIEGRRISIESSSKVWNACGLRIGGLVTDNKRFNEKSVYEYTANLSANSIGQEIFGVLVKERTEELKKWMYNQKEYYFKLLKQLRTDLLKEIPGLIVSDPESSIYIMIDFKNIVNEKFDSKDFVQFCASKGRVEYKDKLYTLLLAPLQNFYLKSNRGKTQLRIAMVESPSHIKKIPIVLKSLLFTYFR